MKLIVNADDFGLTRGVNYGIVDAHELGIVNSTTMLTNMPGTEHAFQLMERYPGLRVGVHLTLSCGKALGEGYRILTDSEGNFKLTNQYRETNPVEMDVYEAEKEWELQINEFYRRGFKPSHLDSHHHIHTWEPLLPIIQKLSEKYDLPVRGGFSSHPSGVKLYSDIFDAGFYSDQVGEDYFTRLFEKYGAQDYSVEVMCHPAYADSLLPEFTSYSSKRLEEFKVLTTVKIPENIKLI